MVSKADTLSMLKEFSKKYLTKEQSYYLSTTDDKENFKLLSFEDIPKIDEMTHIKYDEHIEFTWFTRLLRNRTKNGNPVLWFLGYKDYIDESGMKFIFNIYSFLNLPYCICGKNPV